jgi:hypothetical protein
MILNMRVRSFSIQLRQLHGHRGGLHHLLGGSVLDGQLDVVIGELLEEAEFPHASTVDGEVVGWAAFHDFAQAAVGRLRRRAIGVVIAAGGGTVGAGRGAAVVTSAIMVVMPAVMMVAGGAGIVQTIVQVK